MKLKANHKLLLPDGKTEIEAGQEFEYEGDISGFASVVAVISNEDRGGKVATPPKDPVNPQKMTDEKIRARGKELKITNYHNKGIDKLTLEIAERERKLSEAAVAAAKAREDANNAKGEGAKDPEATIEAPKDPEVKAECEGLTLQTGDAHV